MQTLQKADYHRHRCRHCGCVSGLAVGTARSRWAGRERAVARARIPARLPHHGALSGPVHGHLRHAQHPGADPGQPRVLRCATAGIWCPTPSFRRAWRGVRGRAGPAGLCCARPMTEARAASRLTSSGWNRRALLAQLPCLKPEAVAAGMSEPEAADIDVHALHQGYLRGLRQRGGQVLTHAEVTALQRQLAIVWQGHAGRWQSAWRPKPSSMLRALGPMWWPVLRACPPSGWSRAGAPLSPLRCPRGWMRTQWPAVVERGRELLLQTRCGPAAGLPRQRRPDPSARCGA